MKKIDHGVVESDGVKVKVERSSETTYLEGVFGDGRGQILLECNVKCVALICACEPVSR